MAEKREQTVSMTTGSRPEFWQFSHHGMAIKVAFGPSKPSGRHRDHEPDELSAARGIGIAVMLSCAMILFIFEVASSFFG